MQQHGFLATRQVLYIRSSHISAKQASRGLEKQANSAVVYIDELPLVKTRTGFQDFLSCLVYLRLYLTFLLFFFFPQW